MSFGDAIRQAAQRAAELSALATASGDAYTHDLQGLLEKQGIPSSVLRMEDALQISQQREKYSKQSTPLTMVHRLNKADEQTALFLGDASEAWDKLKNLDRTRGLHWEVEVLISLSRLERNRVVSVSVHTPAKTAMEWDAKTRADFLLDRDQNLAAYSRLAQRWQSLLEEGERFASGQIPQDGRRQNMTIDALLQLLRALKGMTTPNDGVIDGDPLIRIHLEGEMGLALRHSNLDYPEHMAVIVQWLHNIVSFTASNRDLYYDVRTKSFTRKRMDAAPPPSSTIEQVFQEMDE